MFTPEIEEGRVEWSTKVTRAGHLISFILIVAQFLPTFLRRPVISNQTDDLFTPDGPLRKPLFFVPRIYRPKYTIRRSRGFCRHADPPLCVPGHRPGSRAGSGHDSLVFRVIRSGIGPMDDRHMGGK